MSNRRVLTVASGLMAVTLATSAVLAASPIEDRQAAMKAVGKAMGELAKIAKKEKKFDAATVKADAQTIHATSSGRPRGCSPKAATRGTRPGAGGDLEGSFDLRCGARAGREGVAGDDRGDQRGPVHASHEQAGACKNCHDKFRKPEE